MPYGEDKDWMEELLGRFGPVKPQPSQNIGKNLEADFLQMGPRRVEHSRAALITPALASLAAGILIFLQFWYMRDDSAKPAVETPANQIISKEWTSLKDWKYVGCTLTEGLLRVDDGKAQKDITLKKGETLWGMKVLLLNPNYVTLECSGKKIVLRNENTAEQPE